MRLFVAVEIPLEVKKYLSTLQRPIPGIRWVKEHHMHLTLKFLGDVQKENVMLIQDALRAVRFGSFSFFLGKVGFFPNEEYMKVLWIGVSPETQILALHESIDASLKELFAVDHAYQPHITLGRVRLRNQSLKETGKLITEKKTVKVNSFVLMQSTSSDKGVVHSTVESFAC